MASTRARTILHVDDSEVTRYLVAHMLTPAGYTVIQAADADEGLRLLAEGPLPDLAILDVRLPDLSGFEICRRIKANPETALLPVLMLSASFTEGDHQAKGLDAGADAYLTHPVEPLVLLATVRALFRVRDAEAQLEHVNEGLVRANAELRATNDALARATLGAERAQAIAEEARADAERARRAADEANQAKSQFLAMMSHELRTPLNGVGGYLELLEMEVVGPLTPQQHDFVHRARRANAHLLSLINEVLNLSRLESGRVQLEISEVSVAELCRGLEAIVAPQVSARGITYDCIPRDPRAVVRADRDKVMQVLVNLMGNAIKFTEPGGHIGLRVGAAGNVVRIEVHDSGRGIPPDKLGSIFEPFVQVERSMRGDGDGVGLGLAIARDLARLMRGDLQAESTLGAGSVFTLTLPRADRAAADGGSRPSAASNRRSSGEHVVDRGISRDADRRSSREVRRSTWEWPGAEGERRVDG